MIKLSQRELQVALALGKGKPNKIIAFELGVSETTVKSHVHSIMEKLGATNRVQAALMIMGKMETLK